MKLRRLLVCMVLVAFGLALVAPVLAQGGLTLSLHKVIGAGLGGKIQGQWTLSVSGVEGITAVTYELDGAPMATVTQAPFSVSFDTGQYPLGAHQLSATAQTAGGPVKSNVIQTEFVSALDAMGTVLPIVLVLVVLVAGSQVLLPLLTGRRKQRYDPEATHDYGMMGGTICTRCRRPYAMSVLGANLVVGKLQRCPYCGHWSVTRRASPAALKAAEAAAAADARPTVAPAPLGAEEKLRKQLEDSKYQ